ncbi:outer membrane porin, OprD family [Catalinimonas alkaloidigena]|uniref:Outer membrane porin, OprD family n=2 Tax=Catalinimonas alkaloidigena TaxID=1075417 RepID=A0A1G9P0T4_9BACT|nr:outer membrane porin, OprD family [Catalinimonas alkaloidigena]
MLPWTVHAQSDSVQSRGDVSGQWRTYFMSTLNQGDLKDFAALATGGKLKYVHRWGTHLEAAAAFYTAVNLGISDPTATDPATGRPSRYEAGLFNMQDLSQREVALLGEAYLTLRYNRHALTLGRMKLVSPLFNPQDGRMIPTLLQGLWYAQRPDKALDLGAGVFTKVAPRGTDRFYGIGESIGVYPAGRNLTGAPSDYPMHTRSKFLAIGHAHWKPMPHGEVHVWDYWADNVFHTVYLEPAYTVTLGEHAWQLAGQWVHQDRVGEGGNADPVRRYFASRTADVFGVQLQVKGTTTVRLGYNRITGAGQFLFPREWGREGLYTFQKRERSEGNANADALVLTLDRTWKGQAGSLQGIVSAGHHWRASVTEAAANKYAQPSYTHLNLDLFYTPAALRRLQTELLLTYKIGQGDIPENPAFVLNKVDMGLINLIVNYTF